MKKIVIHSPGGYNKLKIVSFPDPIPDKGEVLVETEAAGVNFADCAVRWGLYESAKKFVGWPITPGFEYSGTIKAVGSGVNKVKAGDKVMGVSLFNAYSTHVVVAQNYVFPVPKSFTMPQAAGFPAVFLTGYHALYQQVRLRRGMKVLIHSAAGGVGSSLLQLGKIAGCETVGIVGSSHKIKVAKEFGADHVIDKSKQDLWAEAEKIAPAGYDVILDANGVSTLKQSYAHVLPSGKLVIYGFHSMLAKDKKGRVNWVKLAVDYLRTPRFNPLNMTNENKSLITFNLSFLFDRADILSEAMNDLLRWADEGKLKAPVVTCFPFEDVAKAHQAIESGQSVGKLILTFK